MASNQRGIFWVLLLVLASACGGEDTKARGFPIGTGGAAGAMAAGIGTGGQGGFAGMTIAGASAAIGGMSGGMIGVAGMVASGGVSGAASGGSGGVAGMITGGVGGDGMSGMTGGAGATGGSGGSAGSAPTGDLCMRWKDAHANLTDSVWNGSAASCDPGTLSEDTLAKALTLHSLYRTMAGLEPVEMTDEGNRLAQACALIMNANDTISHTPGSDWDCYTKEGADTAATSSVSSGPALESVDGYMVDPGNSTTLGHRRWILSNMLKSVGFGSAGRFSCQYQPAQRPPSGAKAWVAWPPDGQVPIQSFKSFFANVDQTGWSVQSDTINLGSAQVKVTSDGMDLAVTVTQLNPGYGSTFAIRFNPSGWTTTAGKTYSVSITGTSTPIDYEVEVIDCP